MGIIVEPFSELTDIELVSAVQCILEPLKCSHRADQEVYKKGSVQRFLRGQIGLQPASFSPYHLNRILLKSKGQRQRNEVESPFETWHAAKREHSLALSRRHSFLWLQSTSFVG